jgi:Tol biopolymer transport system component
LFVIPADGSTMNPEELLTSPNNKLPSAWSPDGRELIYTEARSGSRNDILVLPLEGDRKPRELVASG